MSTTISTKSCRRNLTMLWFFSGLALFLILVIQSFNQGVYGDAVSDAWAWFLPTIMPTLSLIVATVVFDATSPGHADKRIDRFYFRLTFGLSAFYLLVVALVMLARPATPFTGVELMTRASYGLGPLQGVVAGALGIFFMKGERGEGGNA